jgi:plastocyanin
MSTKALAVLAAISTGATGLGLGAGQIAAAFDGAHSAGAHVVTLHHSVFSPGTISIRRGESVEWVWAPGRVLHNVIGHSFRSRTMTHGTYTVRFTRSGSYGYTCTVHPHMNGRVIVH